MKCKVCGGTGTSNTCVNGTFKPCTFCDGTGECDANEVNRFNAVDFIKVMEMVKKPQNNEEWFATLSTEEKAEWLCSKEYYCEFIDGCNYCPLFEADKHRCLDLSNKELWELWLKAKHDSEEK